MTIAIIIVPGIIITIMIQEVVVEVEAAVEEGVTVVEADVEEEEEDPRPHVGNCIISMCGNNKDFMECGGPEVNLDCAFSVFTD